MCGGKVLHPHPLRHVLTPTTFWTDPSFSKLTLVAPICFNQPWLCHGQHARAQKVWRVHSAHFLRQMASEMRHR